MSPQWSCCFRQSIPEPVSTPIKVRSVHFEPPAPDSADLQRVSHFRFQESDLDDINSHYEIPPRNEEPLPPTPPPSPPTSRPTLASTPTLRPPTTTTSCDDDRSNELERSNVPTLRRKIRTKTRKSSKSHENEMENELVDSQTEKRYSKEVSAQTDIVTSNRDEPMIEEEVKFLRRMVQKLNVELSKGLSVGNAEILDGKTSASWLHDLRHLAPLLLAFEEEIRQKDNIIDEYESEMVRFKAHFDEMMERQEKIFALGPIDPDRHLFLKENAEIVLAENDLLKDKIENLCRGKAYTEDILSNKVADLQRQVAEARVKIRDIEFGAKFLESENETLTRQMEKANKSLKEMMPSKEYEETVSHYRSTLKQVQDTHEAETVELTRMKKELEIEREELRHRLAKTEMTITALQCENKVYRKMVHKFEDLTSGLRHHVTSLTAERDQLRSELINRSNLLKTAKRRHRTPSSPDAKEFKILARIHKRLADLKMNGVNKDENDDKN